MGEASSTLCHQKEYPLFRGHSGYLESTILRFPDKFTLEDIKTESKKLGWILQKGGLRSEYNRFHHFMIEDGCAIVKRKNNVFYLTIPGTLQSISEQNLELLRNTIIIKIVFEETPLCKDSIDLIRYYII